MDNKLKQHYPLCYRAGINALDEDGLLVIPFTEIKRTLSPYGARRFSKYFGVGHTISELGMYPCDVENVLRRMQREEEE